MSGYPRTPHQPRSWTPTLSPPGRKPGKPTTIGILAQIVILPSFFLSHSLISHSRVSLTLSSLTLASLSLFHLSLSHLSLSRLSLSLSRLSHSLISHSPFRILASQYYRSCKLTIFLSVWTSSPMLLVLL